MAAPLIVYGGYLLGAAIVSTITAYACGAFDDEEDTHAYRNGHKAGSAEAKAKYQEEVNQATAHAKAAQERAEEALRWARESQEDDDVFFDKISALIGLGFSFAAVRNGRVSDDDYHIIMSFVCGVSGDYLSEIEKHKIGLMKLISTNISEAFNKCREVGVEGEVACNDLLQTLFYMRTAPTPKEKAYINAWEQLVDVA